MIGRTRCGIEPSVKFVAGRGRRCSGAQSRCQQFRPAWRLALRAGLRMAGAIAGAAMNPTGSPSASTELWAKLQKAQPPRRTAVQLSRYEQVGTAGAVQMKSRSWCIVFVLSVVGAEPRDTELRRAELRRWSNTSLWLLGWSGVVREPNGAFEEGIPRE